MAEGLGPEEVGKDISEHTASESHTEAEGRERLMTVIEALFLAVVAVPVERLLFGPERLVPNNIWSRRARHHFRPNFLNANTRRRRAGQPGGVRVVTEKSRPTVPGSMSTVPPSTTRQAPLT